MRATLKVLALIVSMVLLAIAWYYASKKTPPLIVDCKNQTHELDTCATQLKECRDSLKIVEEALLKNRVNDALKIRR